MDAASWLQPKSGKIDLSTIAAGSFELRGGDDYDDEGDDGLLRHCGRGLSVKMISSTCPPFISQHCVFGMPGQTGRRADGHARWSLRLLADRMVALGHVESVSHETVRVTLKKTT